MYMFKQSGKCCFGLYTASFCPADKFSYINSAVSRLAIINVALRFAEQAANIPLTQTSLFPHLTQKTRNRSVFHTMLSFCHIKRILSKKLLDTVSVSEYNACNHFILLTGRLKMSGFKGKWKCQRLPNLPCKCACSG